jgi:hypothetical protein
VHIPPPLVAVLQRREPDSVQQERDIGHRSRHAHRQDPRTYAAVEGHAIGGCESPTGEH